MTADLQHEARIVWLESIERLDYVRESMLLHTKRKGRVRWPVGRLIGYSEIDAEYRNFDRCYRRRVFWLKKYDRDSGDSTYLKSAPTEAVDPRTVFPGIPGALTTRAWGRDL